MPSLNGKAAALMALANDPSSDRDRATDDASDNLRVVRGSAFVREFRPPDWTIDGIAPRGFIQTWTALTGHGKTAIAALATVSILTGRAFAGREVERGAVLVLCGENPADYQARLLATLQTMGLDADALDNLAVIDSTFCIEAERVVIAEKVHDYGPLVLVVVDTAAAFFDGMDENDNAAMVRYASSLRGLSRLPGNPAVIVLAHPVKNASRDNLLPRGGGSFLNDVDANLTLWHDGVVTMHWQGKIRGPSFDPLTFELVPVTLNGIVDRKGRPVQSVAARYVEVENAEAIERAAVSSENALLVAMARHSGQSIADLAQACGWIGVTGQPQKSRVFRTLEKLRTSGLVTKGRGGTWALSKSGHKEAEGLR